MKQLETQNEPLSDEAFLLRSVEESREAVLDAGRPEAVAKQHDGGKLTARERVREVADPESFAEFGALVQPNTSSAHTSGLVAPADGVVTGACLIEGRPAHVMSFDYTVVGGSNGQVGQHKVDRVAKLSLEQGAPLIMLLDGGGHRIQEGLDSSHFAHGAPFFHTQAMLSGWVPTAAAVLGPGFAGPSNFAALADFVVMRRGTATMGIAGPALVRAATGENLDMEALGGADVQAHRNGIADLAVDSDEDALAAIRRFLSYLPSNAEGTPPMSAAPEVEPNSDELLHLVPANPRRAYDMMRVLRHVVDRDSLFVLKPKYARNIITAFARLEGRPVGIIANQPMAMAGALDSSACEKAAHFISLCDAFGLALVYFIDVPGFLVGTPAEASGLARRSGRLLYELGQATVPRYSVVLRKGYGLAYVAMCGGRSFNADLAVAWPTAEICAMSVEGAVDVAYRRDVAAAVDPDSRRAELIAEFKGQLGAVRAAERYGIDDVIDPRDTRRILVASLGRAPWRRRNHLPNRRHGISPV